MSTLVALPKRKSSHERTNSDHDPRGSFGNGSSRGIGELIGVSDDEGIELVARIQGRVVGRSDVLRDREENLVGGSLEVTDSSIDNRPVGRLQR